MDKFVFGAKNDEAEHSNSYSNGVLHTKKKIKYGVIPAAGEGKRLGYLSGILPKTLFPVYDRPIIHYVVDLMQGIGIEEIYIIVNVHKEKVIQYFDLVQLDIRAHIHFIEQKGLGGSGDAILHAEEFTKGEPFIVVYGDDCTVTNSLLPMVDAFFKTNPTVMEVVVRENNKKVLQQTCSVKLGNNGKMIEIIEKPESPPYMMRGCGVYLFNNDIYEHIRKTPIHALRKEREITYTIDKLAKEGKAYGYAIDGHNININDHEQLLKASHLVRMLKRNMLEDYDGDDDLAGRDFIA